MAAINFGLERVDGTAMGALLYHCRSPCANPAAGGMMNKQQAAQGRREYG